MAGAPRGNQNAAKAKLWAAAIDRALDRRKSGRERIKAIDELADKLIDLCYDGNLAALQELGNRLDGKPAQSLDVSGAVHHSVEEMTDDELRAIAARGRTGTAKTAGRKDKSTSVH